MIGVYEGGKMANQKRFLLTTILVFVMTSFLFPYISSRIEGVVKDAETGQPISDVNVYLYVYRMNIDRRPTYSTTTDRNGMFLFNDLKNDQYFVMCIHEDYLLSLPEIHVENTKDLSSIVDIIDLHQGQIKHLIINLIKGGKIECKVFLKDGSGVSGLSSVAIFLKNLQINNMRNSIDGQTDKNGDYKIGSLIPDDNYNIKFITPGFPIFETTLSVKKGKTTYLEHIFDSTDNTGVYGIVKLNDKPFEDCGVLLYNPSTEKDISEIDTDGDGAYMIKNVPPGKYAVCFLYLDEKRSFHYKSINIEIKKNEMTQINIDF